MRKEFALTANVKRYVTAVNHALQSPPGIDKFVIVTGEVGQGKTETSLWWKNTHSPTSLIVRVKKAMGPKWLLSDIASEIGQTPARNTQDLFDQVQAELMGSDRALILDEVDYVADKNTLVETIRDIGDTVGIPIVLICMPWADQRLKRYPALMRRVTQRVQFQNLQFEDVRMVMDQICEVAVSDDAVQAILGKAGAMPVYALYRWAQACETLARKHNVSEVRAEHLARQG